MSWNTPPATIETLDSRLHVWRFSRIKQKPYINAFQKVLTEKERAKAARFYFEKDRDAFTIGRAGMRLLAARYLQCAPHQLNLGENAYGKPFLENSDLRFNVSHSGDWVVLGFHMEKEIGVDVEKHREDVRYRDIARRFFSENEVEMLFSLPEDQWKKGFFRCWSLKESYIKACGMGLSMPLGDFDVEFRPGKESGLLAVRGKASAHTLYKIKSISIAEDHSAAIAINHSQLDYVKWDGDYLKETIAWTA